MVVLFLVFWESSTVAAPAYITTNSVQGFPFLQILVNICYLCSFLMIAILTICIPNFVMQLLDIQQGSIWSVDSLHQIFNISEWLMRFFYCLRYCARVFKHIFKSLGNLVWIISNVILTPRHSDCDSWPLHKGEHNNGTKIIRDWLYPKSSSFNIFSLWRGSLVCCFLN